MSVVTSVGRVEVIYQDALVNYLVSMARMVESNVSRALEALLRRGDTAAAELPGQVFLAEPRINEMEIVIDEHAVRLLHSGNLQDIEIRQVVAAIKINNDLERMGDLAVNIAERVTSLAEMPAVEMPLELKPMAATVRAMVTKSLGALIFRNVVLAGEILESDDIVDSYRDQLFERLLAGMKENPQRVGPSMQFILATRYLERIADHATNIAEDIIFWLRGLDVRHGRARLAPSPPPKAVIENSLGRDAALTEEE
ncbi:MAG TPA: phosphate signaling complex protein PhoU [Candidatus Acidoferrales bacterium]|nr:phosphate signaling complex protein PhoU [Candidatus Acidoferrales bacterium]